MVDMNHDISIIMADKSIFMVDISITMVDISIFMVPWFTDKMRVNGSILTNFWLRNSEVFRWKKTREIS